MEPQEPVEEADLQIIEMEQELRRQMDKIKEALTARYEDKKTKFEKTKAWKLSNLEQQREEVLELKRKWAEKEAAYEATKS